MFKRTSWYRPTAGTRTARSLRAVSFAKESGARITFFYSQPAPDADHLRRGALIDPTTPEQFAKSGLGRGRGAILSKAKRRSGSGRRFATATPRSTRYPTKRSSTPPTAIRLRPDLHGLRTAAAGIAGLLLGSETQKVLTHSKDAGAGLSLKHPAPQGRPSRRPARAAVSSAMRIAGQQVVRAFCSSSAMWRQAKPVR